MIIVVGGGINGITSAIALRKRGHDVLLVDPGPLPHPLAASTDISKAVRGAYGPDEMYTAMAERAIPLWREWNHHFGRQLYHEVGFLFMRRTPMQADDFEQATVNVFQKRGRKFERIDAKTLAARFPAWAGERYQDGILEHEAGYAEAARVVAILLGAAKSLGVRVREHASVADLIEEGGAVGGIALETGEKMRSEAVVVAAGSWTPKLLPWTSGFLRATGHPIFHLQPARPDLFRAAKFPVFGADIATTGYYGFPVNEGGVVKIGNHGVGRAIIPDGTGDQANEEEVDRLRTFLAATFPSLADAPIVMTRLCPYCDTHDGDFWIARDPDRDRLTVAAGDNGHGFKFAPLLGDLIADAVEGKDNPVLERFRWRPEIEPGQRKEAARSLSV